MNTTLTLRKFGAYIFLKYFLYLWGRCQFLPWMLEHSIFSQPTWTWTSFASQRHLVVVRHFPYSIRCIFTVRGTNGTPSVNFSRRLNRITQDWRIGSQLSTKGHGGVSLGVGQSNKFSKPATRDVLLLERLLKFHNRNSSANWGSSVQNLDRAHG